MPRIDAGPNPPCLNCYGQQTSSRAQPPGSCIVSRGCAHVIGTFLQPDRQTDGKIPALEIGAHCTHHRSWGWQRWRRLIEDRHFRLRPGRMPQAEESLLWPCTRSAASTRRVFAAGWSDTRSSPIRRHVAHVKQAPHCRCHVVIAPESLNSYSCLVETMQLATGYRRR